MLSYLRPAAPVDPIVPVCPFPKPILWSSQAEPGETGVSHTEEGTQAPKSWTATATCPPLTR